MSLHIERFIDRVQGLQGGRNTLVMTADEAQALVADLARLLLHMQELQSDVAQPVDQVITVRMDGGSY